MKKLSILILLIAPFLFTLSSCKKKSDTEVQLMYMTVKFPNNELKHNLYYQIQLIQRSIELDFSENINSATVSGNVLFYDMNEDLTAQFDIQTSGNKVMLLLKNGYNWNQGWKYYINLYTGLKSEGGLSLQGDQVIELRTGMAHGLELAPMIRTTAKGRNALAIISDIHMGDPRAYANDYCWFGKNQGALEAFLDYVIDSNHIKTLVILGDLFDEWLVPYTISPFDASVNITSTKDFFTAVAGASVNENIFDRLKTIVDSPDILLVYVPGNHDMLGTQDILNDLIPGISWEGGPDGLGKYSPFPEMMFEHGHRYDFFNCPHPLVNTGHMLPPGYFVTRLYAQGMMESAANIKETSDITGSFEFKAAWDVAWFYTITHFSMSYPDANADNILMGGIDGYTANMSFNGAEDMYAANIEDFWAATQAQNQVPSPMACCFTAIWNGHSDMFTPAKDQYLESPPSPKTFKIVAFGHTHEPMLEVYPAGSEFTGIYANSGSWIDADQSSHDVRTYLLIHPKAWTGSEIDVVGLYQYNPASGSAYAPKLIKEESID